MAMMSMVISDLGKIMILKKFSKWCYYMIYLNHILEITLLSRLVKKKKNKLENDAFNEIIKKLPTDSIQSQYLKIWQEYQRK